MASPKKIRLLLAGLLTLGVAYGAVRVPRELELQAKRNEFERTIVGSGQISAFPSSEFPGEFVGGSTGFTAIMRLWADGTLSWEFHNCGGVYETGDGRWKLDGDTIRLLGPRNYGQLIPLKWGSHIFLMREDRLEQEMQSIYLHAIDHDVWGITLCRDHQGKFTDAELKTKAVLPRRYQKAWDETLGLFKE